jgi:hypothetical protein
MFWTEFLVLESSIVRYFSGAPGLCREPLHPPSTQLCQAPRGEDEMMPLNKGVALGPLGQKITSQKASISLEKH